MQNDVQGCNKYCQPPKPWSSGCAPVMLPDTVLDWSQGSMAAIMLHALPCLTSFFETFSCLALQSLLLQ